MRLICLFLGTLVSMMACHMAQVDPSCDTAPVNDLLQEPFLGSVRVNGRIANPDSIFLDTEDKDLVIELQPADVDTYYFKLQAPGWNTCGIASRYPQMQFTFLPGGRHTLEFWVQKNGMSSPHGQLSVTVKELITEQDWYYPSLVAYFFLLAGAIVYFWTLYNIRQKLKLQKVRSRIAADLHDEVSSDLSSIAISMTTLERRNGSATEKFREVMQEIKQTLSDTQSNLSDTVWAIKPDKDTGGELFRRMQKFAQQMFGSTDIRLNFRNTMPVDKPLKITMEQRHNVFKIYKEAIHNIYKHASATEVDVHIFPHPDGIGLEICDNGVGFDLEAEREGSGINNYHWRAKENFIEFSLKTEPGKGVQIEMIIPQF